MSVSLRELLLHNAEGLLGPVALANSVKRRAYPVANAQKSSKVSSDRVSDGSAKLARQWLQACKEIHSVVLLPVLCPCPLEFST